ncbi:MAG: hypothetical protein RMK19_04030 [Bacteroidia bacterium]|nr:hypothetical protein [Bacteroidia bacterium]MDW8015159.1 hypothetical protein [Bacteroidia bacterium]
MEIRLLPLKVWVRMGIWAVVLHTIGALLIDFIMWKSGVVYEVMAGQLLLLAGGVWLLIVLFVILVRLRRSGYLDPLRIILWSIGVSVSSAPLKALGEKGIEPLLQAEYEAYPLQRARALRAYFQAQSESGRAHLSPEKQEEIIQMQTQLYLAYRERQQHLGSVIMDRLKVLGILGTVYGLILGLLLRGGGSVELPAKALQAKSEGNAASS